MSPKPAAEGTSVSEGSKGLSVRGWSVTMGHSPCAWCQLLKGEGLYLPQTGCVWGVRVNSPANFKLDQPASVGHLGPGRGIRWVEGPCWYLGGSMSVRCLWDECECCVFVVSTELDLPASRGPMGQVGGLGSEQGY